MPDIYISSFLYLKPLPVYFRFVIFGIVLVHMVISYVFERYFILGSGVKLLRFLSFRPIVALFRRIRGRTGPISQKKKTYSQLKESLRAQNQQLLVTRLQEDSPITKSASISYMAENDVL